MPRIISLSIVRNLLLVVAVPWIVTGCGDDPQKNRKPTAAAGQDKTVAVGQIVDLDGSQSSDPDGDTITYKWTLKSKPTDSTAALNKDMVQKPSFTADKAGKYVVSLVVSDGTLSSDPAETTITAAASSDPVANAGADADITVGLAVGLDGSASTAAQGKTLTYKWTLEAKPADSAAALDDDTKDKPTFTADKIGAFTFKLIVNDGTKDSAPDSVTITAVARTKPTANAGADATAKVDDVVTLDGSQSTASPGLELTYEWSIKERPADSAAALDDATKDKPTFTADKAGEYTFELVVNDGTEDSDPATVKVTVGAN